MYRNLKFIFEHLYAFQSFDPVCSGSYSAPMMTSCSSPSSIDFFTKSSKYLNPGHYGIDCTRQKTIVSLSLSSWLLRITANKFQNFRIDEANGIRIIKYPLFFGLIWFIDSVEGNSLGHFTGSFSFHGSFICSREACWFMHLWSSR